MKQINNQPKKLLYVDGNPYIIGGREISIESLLFHHKKFVPYILFTDDGPFPQRLKKQGFANVFTLRAKRLRHLHRTIPALWQIARFIRRHDIDLVIANHSHAWVYGGLAARMAGVKAVFYIRGIYHPKEFRISNPLGWITAHWPADLYLANSQASLDSLRWRIGNRVRWEVIYSPIDIRRFSPPQCLECISPLKFELKLPGNHRVIILPGRIQESKGQDVLVRAAPLILEAHPQTVFLIVGAPSGVKNLVYYQKLVSLVESLNLQEKVFFVGFREDMPSILALADVVVLTSTHREGYREGFGRVIAEGMAMSKPVIATEVGGPREIIEHGYDGLLIPPADPGVLAKAINRLLSNPHLSQEIGLRARRKVEENFSIEKIMVRLEEILEELLDKP